MDLLHEIEKITLKSSIKCNALSDKQGSWKNKAFSIQCFLISLKNPVKYFAILILKKIINHDVITDDAIKQFKLLLLCKSANWTIYKW